MYAHVILIVIGYHLPTYSCTYTHRYFHVCNGGLVPDIMHDVLEGALEYEVKLMLAHMISQEKYFTLNQFNSRLEKMELGYMEAKDCPTLIANTTLFSASNKLKQEGILLSYMHTCTCITPLMCGCLLINSCSDVATGACASVDCWRLCS